MANPSLETLVSGQKTILDTLQAFVGISLDSLEKASSHHLSSHRRVVEQQFAQSNELLGSKDASSILSLGSKFIQPHIDHGIDYLRGLHEIASDAQEQTISLLERNHAELHKSISSSLDWYAKSSGNADAAVAAVRSAVTAANSAFETAHKAARQVASITDASVKAATNATSRAIEVNSPTRKKAA